jgi:flavorubredoxin
MITTYRAAPGIDVVTSSTAIPGLGSIAINAFVLHGEEPVLVDTGAVVQCEEFVAALRTVIDPDDIRWIWLTHPDPDHTGALHSLLAVNPRIRVVSTFLGVGIMGLSAPLPMERVHLLNPGQHLRLADRTLTAVRPPVFDNPTTTGFLDDKTGALCSSDCFGALLEAVPVHADELSAEELRQGQVLWATIDSPWVQRLDPAVFARELDVLRALEPSVVLSSHLPPAPGAMFGRLVDALEAVPGAPPFVGPDQLVLEQMLAHMAGQGAP